MRIELIIPFPFRDHQAMELSDELSRLASNPVFRESSWLSYYRHKVFVYTIEDGLLNEHDLLLLKIKYPTIRINPYDD